jgi:uncharacterized membrane protein YkoI
MKQTMHVGLLATLLLALPIVAAQAQQQQRPGTERAAPAPKITEEQAKKVALERIPGEVTDVTIERKKGRNVYVVEIRTSDGDEKDVFVDIASGQIVGTD